MLCPRLGRGRPSASAALRARWARRTSPQKRSLRYGKTSAPETFSLTCAVGHSFAIARTAKERAARPRGARVNEEGHPDGAAVRERARQEEAEKERAERRKLIALNKLGEAAATVRREWVREKLLSRKTAPKGAALYLAQAIVTRPDLFNDYHGQKVAPEMLGLADNETPKMAVAKLPATGDGRALVILLGMVLATTEARTAKDAWRGPQDITKTYLRFLEENGYTLSDIEQVILGKRSSEGVLPSRPAETASAGGGHWGFRPSYGSGCHRPPVWSTRINQLPVRSNGALLRKRRMSSLEMHSRNHLSFGDLS